MARRGVALDLLIFGALALLWGACAHTASSGRALQIASFDYAWTRIHDTYPDPAFHGVDWLALREELAPEAEKARDAAALRPVLEEMFGRLGDSHFAIIPGGVAPDGLDLPPPEPSAASDAPGDAPPGQFGKLELGEIGVDLRPVDGQILLSRVDAGSPAEAAGLRPGEILRAVDGLSTESVVAVLPADEGLATLRAILLGRLSGLAGSVARVEIEGGDGAVRTVQVRRAPVDAPWVALGSLPSIPVHFSSERLPDGVGLIRFDVFMEPVPDRFTAAMTKLLEQPLNGVVLDLRGNPGGVAPMAMGMAGHFISRRGQSLGVLQFRDASWNLLVNPRAACFDGPLAVLVDELSASTSEIMAAGLQKLGRARVFGSPSAGMALPSTWERLPNGDLMQFVTGDYTAPDGTRVEREGVHPDELTPITRAALLEGRDPALDAARAWIAASNAPPAKEGVSP